ncbi:MAG: RluA family pseudouridine synthase [Desulfobacteraceae bacterium]|nr:MAG: RluA family pseudouridine synthase [Desulfobacteraceae bacterium]
MGDKDWQTRLDQFLSSKPTGLSRTRIQALIKEGMVLVDGALCKPSRRLSPGEVVTARIPHAVPCGLKPEHVIFDVLYEDGHIIVIDKPAGLVVHPAAGHHAGTLVHGVLARCRGLSGIGGVERPGVVHRLDKDTSGVMVMAKDDESHLALSGQFQAGEVKKEYLAIVHGRMEEAKGTVDFAIGRHPRRRKEMSVVLNGGRAALTIWRRLKDFEIGFSLISVTLKTGRTHQIRVHMSHLGHPVVGDAVYGYSRTREASHKAWKDGLLPRVSRQLLHSRSLGIRHPASGRYMEFEAPVPDDMEVILKALDRGEKPDS